MLSNIKYKSLDFQTKVLSLYEQGKNNKEISLLLQSGKATVSRTLKYLDKRPNGILKIKPDIESQILLLHSNGFKNIEIGKKLKCGNTSIRRVLIENNLKTNSPIGQKLKIINNLGQCSRCKNWLDLSEYKLTLYKGYLSKCQNCLYETEKSYCKNNLPRFISHRLPGWKTSAKKSNVIFGLTKSYLIELYDKQKGLCFYSDQNLKIEIGPNDGTNTSLDRIMPKLGYIEGNVVFCLRRFNTSKTDLTLEEIKKYMPLWYSKIIECEWLFVIKNNALNE